VFYLALAHHIVHVQDETSEPDGSGTPENRQGMLADQSGLARNMSGRMGRSTPNGPLQSKNLHVAPPSLLEKTSETSGDVQTSEPDDPAAPKNADDGHSHLSAEVFVTTETSEMSEVREYAAANSVEQPEGAQGRPWTLAELMQQMAVLLRNGASFASIAKTFKREGLTCDGVIALNTVSTIARLWERHKQQVPCPQCGDADWDHDASGQVICIPCSERDESTTYGADHA
jgi:hypothetical protein